MGLTFLNGAFLGALTLVGVPILIHLLQRRRFRVVRWGAMEFLQVSQRQRRRRLLLEQLLLLLLRCLVIALVVLAVSRPVARAGAFSMPGGRGPIHAVLILDTSASMGYRAEAAGTETLLDRSRRRALELVERGLRQGDAVSIILATDPPRTLVRRPSLDLPAVAGLLRRSTPQTDLGTSYGKAARLALEILHESPFVNREVYLFADNQAAGWEGPAGQPAAWEALAALARVIVLPAREAAAANVAVTGLRAARGLALVGGAARLQARIVNHGRTTARGVLARLEVDGKPTGAAQRVDVEPGKELSLTFSPLFAAPGVYAVAVRLSPDRLPADDAAYLALRVRRSVRVVLLNGAPNLSTPQRDAGFFLQLALAPPAAGVSTEPSPLELRTLTGASLGGATREADVVILSNVAALSEPDRRALAEFVQNGGGLLLFPGDRVNPALYNRDLLATRPPLLPARLGPLAATRTTLDAATLDHPALDRFRGAQDVDVGTAEFLRYFRLEPAPGDDSIRVMARFASGDPALVERRFGLGRVVLAASAATTDWNTLPVKPFFLPLLHQLSAHLAGGADAARGGRVGEPQVRALPLAEATRTVTITGPGGGRRTLKPEVDARGASVTLPAPEQAGFYRLSIPGGTQDVLAVNLDPAESDLRILDQAALRRLLPLPALVWVGINEDLVSALARSRTGVELWRPLLIAAVLLLLLETMLAQLFGRRA